jgi:hypothetical protein
MMVVEEPGTVIDFSIGGNSFFFRSEGWSVPEQQWIWAIGYSSTLVLPQPRPAARHLLSLELFPFCAPVVRDSQRIEVLIDDKVVYRANLSRPATIFVEFADQDLRRDGRLVIELRHPDALAPADIRSEAPDPRVLAFAIRRVSLRSELGTTNEFANVSYSVLRRVPSVRANLGWLPLLRFWRISRPLAITANSASLSGISRQKHSAS